MGAKQTPDLIPLCHPLAISGVTVDLAVADDAVEISATVRTTEAIRRVEQQAQGRPYRWASPCTRPAAREPARGR